MPFLRDFCGSKVTMILCVCLFGTGTLVWLLQRKHAIGSDLSPDGRFRADYSYRVRSPVELFFGPRINPRMILEIVDVRTGDVVSTQEELGDFAELSEVREFFAKSVPWTHDEQ
jgi:hypothetical protein